jgi:hypothetical protein
VVETDVRKEILQKIIAGSQMAKREISAKAFVKDFRSGMDEAEILEKYSLSQERLRSVLDKLVAANALGREEIDSWLSVSKPASGFEDAEQSGDGPLVQSGPPRRLRVSRKTLEPTAAAHSAETPAPSRDGSETAGYRLKLYGRTSNDPDAFCANLAAVLGIDGSTARDYLNRVPVTMKEGLSEQKAERLRTVLASVGALCLVEPMDGVELQPSLPSPTRETALADALLMRPEKTGEDSGFLPSRMKPSLLALVSVVFFLCVAGLYLLIATRSVREDMAVNAPRQKVTPQETQTAKTVSDEEALPMLKGQIIYLEEELPKLKARLTEEQAGFDLLVKTPGVPYDDLQKRNFAVQEIQEQISTTGWQIRTLKKKVNLLERHLKPAEEAQPASQPEQEEFQ